MVSLNLDKLSPIISYIEQEYNRRIWVSLQTGKTATKQEIKEEMHRILNNVPENIKNEVFKINDLEKEFEKIGNKIKLLKFYSDAKNLDFDKEIEVTTTFVL